MKHPLILSDSEIEDLLREGTCEHRITVSESNGRIDPGDKLFIGMRIQLEVSDVRTEESEYIFSFKLIGTEPFCHSLTPKEQTQH